ncbi:GNAT family N-acetyltransferase [Granulicella aggregans]|jgi:N-acetylglutamate synthase-like GNAT family acetyltransferase|uniref:GNAT family N-acetyltransferase n=1 Tax=Granulicella aggregans TaxID=474949 RepID=UPI0021E09A0E|nr:GNAT family N-acetyltransferase [Granulicella aggregans]
MAFHFRAATVADIPAIRELIAASVLTLQVEYTPEQRELALTTVFTVDTQLVADGTYLLAFSEDGALAGCGGWSKRKTLYGGDHQVEAIEPELLDPQKDAAKIRAIFIHPSFARQGLGTAILVRSEDAAKDAGFKSFEMGSTLSGVPLYSLKGYRKLEEITVPVGAGEGITVVRMVKGVV